jgi:hypothetical protein
MALGLATSYENPDYCIQYRCEQDSTYNYRAVEAHTVSGGTVYRYFEGSWTFLWDEGTADTLVLTFYDLYDSSGTTGIEQCYVETLDGGWTYGDWYVADSVCVDASRCSDDIDIRAIGWHPEDTRECTGSPAYIE